MPFLTLNHYHHYVSKEWKAEVDPRWWLHSVLVRGGADISNGDGETSTTTMVDDDSSSSTSSSEVNKGEYYFEASKPGDGSDADPDGLPTRYLTMQKGDRIKAKAAFEETVKWRKEHDINSLLQRSHEKYDLCKRIFPVTIPGRDLANNIVVIQQVGRIDFDLAKQNGIVADDLLAYYVYMVEYCWNILEPAPDAVMTTVMDLQGVKFGTIRDKEIRIFLLKFVKTMSDHYPSRSHKTLILNCPSWINMIYKLVRPLLRESTKKKITLMNGGSEQDQALLEILGTTTVEALPDDVFRIYSKDKKESMGSLSTSHGDSHPTTSARSIEEDLRSFVLAMLKKNGDSMQEAV